MTRGDLADLPTGAVLERALEAAREETGVDDDARWECLEELVARRDPAVLEAARGWCESDDAAARALGADLLAQLEGDAAHRAASVTRLAALLDDPDPDVIAAALLGLGRLDGGDPARISLLAEHESEDVRHGVASVLAGRVDEISIQTTLLLSMDEDPDVRAAAAFGLASCEDDTAVVREALRALVDDPESEVRGEALMGLARRSDEGAVDAVLRELRESPSALAVRAAALCASPDLLEELEKLDRANPEDPQIRAALDRCRTGSDTGAV